MNLFRKFSRRRLLKQALGAAAAGLALPHLVSCRRQAGVSANDVIGVGIIGCGRRNGQLVIGKGGQGAPPDYAQIVAVADFNKNRAGQWAKNYRCPAYQDYRQLLERKDVDVVIYATPEHWHYLPCIHACQAGKDVYGEQPLSHTIREGRGMAQAVRKYKRVFQTGEQQRSHPMTRAAAELILNGRIGKIQSIIGFNYPSPYECDLPAQPIPSWLDGDRWCGPNEVVPYNTDLYLSRIPYEREPPYPTQPPERFAVGPGWMSFRPYSGGELANWGCHGLSVVQLVLGMDKSGPVEIWVDPAEKMEKCVYDTPEKRDRGDAVCSRTVINYKCANGVVLSLRSIDPKLGGGATFVGDKGRITVFRGGYECDPEGLDEEPLGALLAACTVGLAKCPAAQDKPTKETSGKQPAGSIQYLPLDAPAGMSQAVIVQGFPLVHTRQLLPLNREGKLVGEGSADKQIDQVLANLEAVLKDLGSGLGKLVRLNVYALSPAIVTRVRELLSKRLDPAVRPTITSVLTSMTHRKAMVAVDAVAVSNDPAKAVALKRCRAVAGDKDCADAALLPPGGVAYLSGQPDEAGLTVSAVAKSMSDLAKTLGHLKLSPAQVVQLKVFLKPATAADEVLRQLKQAFPGQLTPPVVFVEWFAAVPIEIELIAQSPLRGKSAETVEYFTPPEVRPAPTFSKVALVRRDRQIYISTLFARERSRGQPQADDIFEQLQAILDQTGSDLRHMAKGTYYVSDDDAARRIDRTRFSLYDPTRPPAASKVTVHGVGQAERTMSVDVIAVASGK